MGNSFLTKHLVLGYYKTKGGKGIDLETFFKMGQANCHLTSEPLDGFLNFKKEKWSKLNFKCIELLPSNQAATKAAMTAAT